MLGNLLSNLTHFSQISYTPGAEFTVCRSGHSERVARHHRHRAGGHHDHNREGAEESGLSHTVPISHLQCGFRLATEGWESEDYWGALKGFTRGALFDRRTLRNLHKKCNKNIISESKGLYPDVRSAISQMTRPERLMPHGISCDLQQVGRYASSK